MISLADSSFRFILGSGSPRRKELLLSIIPQFTIRKSDADENAPMALNAEETAIHVSKQKAIDLIKDLKENELLITADTEVWLGNRRFGKPANAEEANEMLQSLSGYQHQVVTGFCLASTNRIYSEAVITQVFFKDLQQEEIDYYIKNYQPFDKAGAYGIQEWIGLIGIQKIEGSYFNVVGLPIQELNNALQSFLRTE